MRASDEGFGKKGTLNTSNVRKRGGLLGNTPFLSCAIGFMYSTNSRDPLECIVMYSLAGFPPSQEVRRSRMLTEEDLSYYVQQYTHSTFRGPLNW